MAKRGRPPIYDYDALAVQLYEELIARPNGMEMPQIMEFLDVNRRTASKVITTLRIALGQGDVITVPIVRKGQKQIYTLAGNLDDCRPWLQSRAREAATKLLTDVAAMKAIVKGTDGRTLDGRIAKQFLISLERAEEDATSYLQAIN